MFDEQEHLNPALPLYYCHQCRLPANHPVLPPCGHLHCWKCLHQSMQCSACTLPFDEEELFSIFVNHQEENLECPLPPKPKPKYKGKIKNSGGMNAADGPSLLRYQNNLERSALLAGYAYFPPLVINSLSSVEDDNESAPGLKVNMGRIQLLLILIVLLMLLLS